MLKIKPSSSPTYYFDRSFSGSWWKQILWLVGAVALTVLFFWSISLYLFPNPEDFEIVGAREPEGRLMLLFRLFYDPGSIEHLTVGARNFGVVVIIVGLVLFMGMLISVISNILERHIQRYMNGTFEYTFNNHDIILGYNKTVPGLIKTICQKLEETEENIMIGKSGILLLSERSTDSIRKELTSQLTDAEMRRVVIKSGNRNSLDVLNGISLEEAAKVWIVGEENEYDHDSLNIDCVSKIVDLCKSYKRFKKGISAIEKAIAENKNDNDNQKAVPYFYPEKLDVQVLLNRQSAFRAFQSTDMSKEWKKVINFRANNFCDDWARYVLVNRGERAEKDDKVYRYPAIENPSGNKYIDVNSNSFVHLVVFGMTDMGLSIAVRAAHMVHLPNFTRDSKLKTRITFVDLEADSKMKDFRNRYQYLFEIQSATYRDLTGDDEVIRNIPPTKFTGDDADFLDVHFEFIKANANDLRLKEYIRNCANDQNDVLSLAICFNDPDYNLQIGQNLPFEVYFPEKEKNPVPVFIRQMTNGKLIDELRSAPKFKNLYPFGMLNESHAISDKDELCAMRINFTYDQCHDDNYDVKNDEDGYVYRANYKKLDDIKTSWYTLQTSLQWSNLYCLDGFEIRRRNLGDRWGHLREKYKYFTNDEQRKECSSSDIVLDEEIALLSEIEHNRWNIEKLLMGYRKPTSDELDRIKKDKAYKNECKNNMFVHLDLQSYEKLKIVDPGAIKYDTIIMANIENIMKE